MTEDELDLPEGLPPALRRGAAALATRPKVLWWTIGLLIGLGFLTFLAVGANGPEDPVLVDAPTTTQPPRTPPPGFGETALHVSGAPTPWCVLVADNDDTRARGMMTRTDFGGYDGMLFVFPQPTNARFHMRNTPLPLTIAWFDANGGFVSSTDMPPCEDRDGCPTYRAARRYRFALEVPLGGLARLGVGPGTQLTTGGPCPPPT